MFNYRHHNKQNYLLVSTFLVDLVFFFYLSFNCGAEVAVKEESWKDRMNWSLKICLLQLFIYLKTDPDYRNFKVPILITDRNECYKTETANTLLMRSGKKKRGEDSNSCDTKDVLN